MYICTYVEAVTFLKILFCFTLWFSVCIFSCILTYNIDYIDPSNMFICTKTNYVLIIIAKFTYLPDLGLNYVAL